MFFKPIKLCINYAPADKYAVCTDDVKFTWSFEHENPQAHQIAYRIQAYDRDKMLWDSGQVISSDSFAIYNGLPLQPQMRVKWQLVLEDDMGNTSDVSYGNFKVVPNELKNLKWITKKGNADRCAVYFSKEFKCLKSVTRATLYVCGIGCHSASINSIPCDDAVLQPVTSNFAKQCYFVSLEVENLLNVGNNILCVKVGEMWRNDRSWHVPVEFRGPIQLAARLVIEYTDNTSEIIETDDTWNAANGAIIDNNIFDGEVFDASLENINIEHAIIAPDAGKLIPQCVEPIKIQKKIKPISKTLLKPGVYIFDFGKNIAGFAEIKIPNVMKKGDRIVMTFSEEIDEYGDLSMDTMRKAKSTDVYISNGKDSGRIWRPEFTYHGFRYMRLSGWRGIPQDNDIMGCMIYSDVDNTSYFRCGSAIVNAIHNCAKLTERDNIHGIATDCPQRNERIGWLNDATVRFEEIAYNFNVARLFPKIIADIRAEQSDDGSITCTAPFVIGQRPADPVCSSYIIAGLQSWLHYGNIELLKSNYDGFKAWNECLKNNSENGIVNYSYYGDWAGPVEGCVADEDARSKITPGIMMSTGYHYYNYRLLAEVATILNDKSERDKNLAEARRVQAAFLDKWWNEDTGIVATGSQACQTFALWLGILPKSKRTLAAKRLHDELVEKKYKITTGNLTTRYLMDVLADNGYIDDAWEIITREEYPSLGYMLQNGSTTIWERFEQKRNNAMNSHNHPMYAAVDAWLYSRIAGIVPLSDAWKHFRIKPIIPTKLLSAEAKIDTPRGDILIRWFKRYDKLNIHINIPCGTKALYEYANDRKLLDSGFYCFSYDI